MIDVLLKEENLDPDTQRENNAKGHREKMAV